MPVETKTSNRTLRRVCVFCGSSTGTKSVYSDAATTLGWRLGASGIGLVFGGGRVGLMGKVADSVLDAGGQAIGVIPRDLADKEIAHTALTKLHVVESMHERKALMADLADAFILLPGGFGSWEEFCEIVTWLQLGIHHKPCGIFNVAGYYDALLAQSSHAVAEGFLAASHREMIVVADTAEALLSELSSVELPTGAKWLPSRDR
jgi:uncharacterized protein (TIGR00730 family)